MAKQQPQSAAAAREVIFSLRLNYDQRNAQAINGLQKAVEEQNKRMANGAGSTAKKMADEWGKANRNLLKDDEKLSKDLGRIWDKYEKDRQKSSRETQRADETRAKNAIRDAAVLKLHLGQVADSAISFGKAISIGSLVGEKNMESLVSKLLAVEAGFEAVRSGAQLVGGVGKLGRSLQGLGAAGPGAFGSAVQAATGSAILGNAAWRMGAAGGRVAGVVGAGLGALATPLGAAAAATVGAGLVGYSAYREGKGATIPESQSWANWAMQGPEFLDRFAPGIASAAGAYGITGPTLSQTWQAVAKQNKQLAAGHAHRQFMLEQAEQDRKLLGSAVQARLQQNEADLSTAQGNAGILGQVRQRRDLDLEEKYIGFAQAPKYQQDQIAQLDARAIDNADSLSMREKMQVMNNPLSSTAARRAVRASLAKQGEEQVGEAGNGQLYAEERQTAREAHTAEDAANDLAMGLQNESPQLKKAFDDIMKPVKDTIVELLKAAMERVGGDVERDLKRLLLEMQQNDKNAA